MTTEDRVARAARTRARYDSRCPACRTAIVTGDVIGLCDGAWVCQGCGEAAQ
jgi:ribosomal protein L37AE/L43A